MLLAHSGFRYIYLLAALAVMGYALYGLITKRPYDKTIHGIFAVQMLSLDLTAFLGIAAGFSSRTRTVGLGPHIATMLFAIVVLHIVSKVMRGRPEKERTYAPYLVATVVALALVWVGIAALGRPLIG